MLSFRKGFPYQLSTGNAVHCAGYVSVQTIHRTVKPSLLLARQFGESHKATDFGENKVLVLVNVERTNMLRCSSWLSLNKKLKFTTSLTTATTTTTTTTTTIAASATTTTTTTTIPAAARTKLSYQSLLLHIGYPC